MAVDNDPSFSMGNVLKAGLAVLAAEGLYLWAFDKDDKDDSPSTPDLIAPAAPTATLADDTVTVTGKSEANAKLYSRFEREYDRIGCGRCKWKLYYQVRQAFNRWK